MFSKLHPSLGNPILFDHGFTLEKFAHLMKRVTVVVLQEIHANRQMLILPIRLLYYIRMPIEYFTA